MLSTLKRLLEKYIGTNLMLDVAPKMFILLLLLLLILTMSHVSHAGRKLIENHKNKELICIKNYYYESDYGHLWPYEENGKHVACDVRY